MDVKTENFASFRIKFYGLGELAMIYNPDCSPSTAAKRFNKWMNLNRDLRRELKRVGWRKGNRILTPKQVACIVEFIGEP